MTQATCCCRLSVALALGLWAAAAPEASAAGLRSTAAADARNPLLERYTGWARAYEKDAQEAEAAAAKYSYMTQALQASQGGGAVSRYVAEEMSKGGVKKWANAVWTFEKMLRDPAPGRGARAAEVARARYMKEYEAYRTVAGQYTTAAQQYSLLAARDDQAVSKLTEYEKQQGKSEQAAEARQEAEHLVKQSQGEKALAEEYTVVSKKIVAQLPEIYKMANQAATYAAWKENPHGAPADFQLIPFTVAPPLAAVQPLR